MGRCRLAAVISVALLALSVASVQAAPPDDTIQPVTTSTVPVVPVPAGCEAPPLPRIVFVGTVAQRDRRAVLFDVDSVRAGDSSLFEVDGQIVVRYGRDVQYLSNGETYLVGAGIEPRLGVLYSRASEPIEDFGGDEVIGLTETDIQCPDFEDPIRTLHLDGTPVEAGVLAPLGGAEDRLLTALVVPLAVAVGVIFLVALLRVSLSALWSAMRRGPR